MFQITYERKPPNAQEIKERKQVGLNDLNARPQPDLLPQEKVGIGRFLFCGKSSCNFSRRFSSETANNSPSPWAKVGMGEDDSPTSRGQPFAMWLVIAVPVAQGLVAGIGKKKFQRRRFNMAVAKHHVEFALMTYSGGI